MRDVGQPGVTVDVVLGGCHDSLGFAFTHHGDQCHLVSSLTLHRCSAASLVNERNQRKRPGSDVLGSQREEQVLPQWSGT